MAQPIHFKAIVESVERHGNDIASYRLRSEKKLPRFIPGQFIHLTIEEYDRSGFWPESRVFSVANAVADRRTIDLTISRQGSYTSRIIDEIQQGSTVWGKGPYGEFTVGAEDGCNRAVLLAGGTGITPFCAFMDGAVQRGALPVEEVVLYYGARTADLLIYRELAERCAATLSGFHVRLFVEQTEAPQNTKLNVGRLELPAIMNELGDTDRTTFYISGPRPMIEGFRQRLTIEYGVDAERVHIDAWE
jgi:ferredoxin-NADP reductase